MEILRFILGAAVLTGIWMGGYYLLELRGKSDPKLQPYIEEKDPQPCEERENALLNYDEGKAKKALDLLLQAYEFYQGINLETLDKFEPDLKKAFDLALQAAELGDATAQYNVSSFFSYGEGTPLDYGKSVYWARKAAEQDGIGGQIMLATLYANGLGVERDLVEAYKWARLAAREAPIREHRWYYSYLKYDYAFKFLEALGIEERQLANDVVMEIKVEQDRQRAKEMGEKIRPYLSNEGLIEANKRVNQWLCK